MAFDVFIMHKDGLGNLAKFIRMESACFSIHSCGGKKLVVWIRCSNLMMAPPFVKGS
jgi:hypothetical protein